MFWGNKKCKQPVGCFVSCDLIETEAPMSSALVYVRACYPLMIPDETCTVVTPVQARGICFIGKKMLSLSLEM